MYQGAGGLVRNGPEQQQLQQGPELPLDLGHPCSDGGHSGELSRIRNQLPELFPSPWSLEGPLVPAGSRCRGLGCSPVWLKGAVWAQD